MVNRYVIRQSSWTTSRVAREPTVKDDRREQLLKLLSDIDQEIAEAERLTVEPPDEAVLSGASAVLAELREALARAERQIRREDDLRKLR
jgi:hypothetical protein